MHTTCSKLVPFFLGCLGLLTLPSAAQTVIPQAFTHSFLQTFSRKHYNASTQNWSVLQDKRGVVYVGNGQGVLENNGQTWRLIALDNHSAARAMTLAGDTTIFVAGSDELGYLAPDSLGLLQYRSLVPSVGAEDRDFGAVWFVHAMPEGVYFQSSDRLFRWSGQEAMEMWRPPVRFNTSAVVRDTLYVHSYGEGLLRMQGDSLVFVPGSERFAEAWIFVMLPFDAATIFLGTRDQGFFLFDGERFEPFPTDVDAFLQTYTLYFPGALLNDGTIALGTSDAGLLILDRQGRLVHHLDRRKGLPNERIHYVYPDREQGLWLALNNGIARLEMPSPLTFINEAMGLPQSIMSLARQDGMLYVGTRSGLFMIDEHGKRVSPVAGASKSIWNLLPTPDALFATTNGGLYRIDGRRVTHWEMFRGQVTNDYAAFSIHRSKVAPDVLFVGRRDGLDVVRYDPDDPAAWTLLGSIPGIDGQVSTIHELAQGRLQLGVDDGVIHLAYTDSTLLAPATIKYGEAEGLPGGSVWAYEAAGTLFYATADGLYRFEPEHTRFVRVDSLFPGISFEDAATFGNLTDGLDGDVWITAKEGVYQARPTPEGGYTTRSAPFHRFADWTITVVASDSGGVTWFGGIDGLVRYDARVKKPYDAVPPPLIHRVTRGGHAVVFGGPGAPIAARSAPAPAFRYAENTVRFDYQAPVYDMPERVRYQSMLQGFDRDWSDWTEDAWRVYTNLPEGRYTFQVRARNAYGAVGEEARYAFRINAPWWQTPWAYLGYVLAGVGVLVGLGFIERRWLLARERVRAELEKARALKDINAELQDALRHLTETQAQLIQQEKMASLGQLTSGIAHEIKNPLNFINNFSEVVVELAGELQDLLTPHLDASLRGEADDVSLILSDLKQNAGVIVHHGKRADGIIRSMMQHASGGAGQREATDVNALVEEYVGLAYHGKRAQVSDFNVEVRRDLDEEAGTVEIVPREIGRVLLNLLGNAFDAVREKADAERIKDAETGGRGDAGTGYRPTVTVSTHRNGEAVEIRVADNGPGIPATLREKIFEPFFTTKPAGSGTGLGLSLSYDIVAHGHGGTLAVESGDEGTTFVITLPKTSAAA